MGRNRLADMSGVHTKFKPTVVPHEGKRLRGFMVECSYCGCSTSVALNTFAGSKDADEKQEKALERKFSQKGWKVSHSSKPLCPGCFAKVRNAQKAKLKLVKDSEMAATLPTVGQEHHTPESAIRQLGVDEAILISEKLRDVYAGAKVGYSDGWTDARVASDLSVPRDWVVQVRRKQFGGGLGDSDEIREILRESKDLLSEVKSHDSAIQALISELRALFTKADKIEKTIICIEQAMR